MIPVQLTEFGKIAQSYLIRPLLREVIQQHFPPGREVTGRILMAFPREQLFILRTRGLNLVAKSHLTLFRGDRIRGKVVDNRDRIELKLLEVNGKPVASNLLIERNEIQYVRVPLPQNLWGQEGFLEIYPEPEEKQDVAGSGKSKSLRLLLDLSELQYIALELSVWEDRLWGSVWVKEDGLFHFLKRSEEEICRSLRSDLVETVDLRIFPMAQDVSHFRRKWIGLVEVDLRI